MNQQKPLSIPPTPPTSLPAPITTTVESNQDEKITVVFYESPHRILKTLKSLDKNLMASRKIVIARELTKIYEEVISGNSKEVLDYFEKNPQKIKGEFVVMVEDV